MTAQQTKIEPFKISRTFDAPRELVWKCFTEPERMAQWFGPKGYKTKYTKMDFRIGGTYHYCNTSVDGKDVWGKMTYKEIVKPERIVNVQHFSDEKGGITHHPMSPTWPAQLLTVFTFKEEGPKKTTFTIEWTPIDPSEDERQTFEAAREGMKGGWGGTFERLTEYLKTAK